MGRTTPRAGLVGIGLNRLVYPKGNRNRLGLAIPVNQSSQGLPHKPDRNHGPAVDCPGSHIQYHFIGGRIYHIPDHGLIGTQG
jgi:hypothetical protein